VAAAVITIYSDRHQIHRPPAELHQGELIPHLDVPERTQAIVAHIQRERLGPVQSPDPPDLRRLRRVHSPEFLEFLQTAARMWAGAGRPGAAMPYAWRPPRSSVMRPQGIDGLLGWYATDACTPITGQTWEAAVESTAIAITGARLLMSGAAAALAVCRPPGHHAGPDYYGGYCYLNNAALAADLLAEGGTVTILDIDYHHGNGTQDIFWSRSDVVYASIHADTSQAFPYFSGGRRDIGEGAGRNATRNFPIPPGAPTQLWLNAFANALAFGLKFHPNHLVVSLGVDTAVGDPTGTFSLSPSTYAYIGREIAQSGIPTLFILEGGYQLDMIGVNCATLIKAHDQEFARLGG
jgi:acetoin utilization deacetylase AcuC-like enzyme